MEEIHRRAAPTDGLSGASTAHSVTNSAGENQKPHPGDSTNEYRFATDDEDPERQAVYDAEATWWEELCDYADPEFVTSVDPAAVTAFMRSALDPDWRTAGDPVVLFNLPDRLDLAGMYRGATHTIHLDPRLTDKSTLLHELSHWLDDQVVHGPMFQANMVTLVHRALGARHAADLLDAYREHGLTPDPRRLPEVRSSPS